jgi:mannan endo-1,4-beta-mannosidase
MPQTLVLGSQGEDVKLLQRTLNQRPPTALPLLWVDGDFGPVTLARVKEFQRNNSLWVDGVVGPLTWGKLLEYQPIQRHTLFVKGRDLYDAHGNKVILRGINLPLLDNWDFSQGDRSGKLPELAKTGANTVRLQWQINYSHPDRPPYSLFLLEKRSQKVMPSIG